MKASHYFDHEIKSNKSKASYEEQKQISMPFRTTYTYGQEAGSYRGPKKNE